jgi:hypothetical protein
MGLLKDIVYLFFYFSLGKIIVDFAASIAKVM